MNEPTVLARLHSLLSVPCVLKILSSLPCLYRHVGLVVRCPPREHVGLVVRCPTREHVGLVVRCPPREHVGLVVRCPPREHVGLVVRCPPREHVGLVVRCPPRERQTWVQLPLLSSIFFQVSVQLQIRTPVATLPGARCYSVVAETGWPGVGLL